MNERAFIDKLKKGQKKMKPGFFGSAPDYLSAIDILTEAANGLRACKNFQQSIEAYKSIAVCQKGLNDYYQVGVAYSEIANIYIYDLKDFANGMSSLRETSYNYKVSGKANLAVKVFIDLAKKFKENGDLDSAEKVLVNAFEECSGTTEKLIAIAYDEVVEQLMDVYCGLEKYELALEKLNTYIEEQRRQMGVDLYKLSKNYIKLGMLRIITGEGFLIDDIIQKMINSGYSDAREDAADLRKLKKSIESLNKKDFQFCIGSAFALFPNNILKALQKAYSKQEKEGPIIEPEIDSSKKIIHLDPTMLENMKFKKYESIGDNKKDNKKEDNGADDFL